MKNALFAFFGTLVTAGVAIAQTPNFAYTDRVVRQGSLYLTTAVTILMVLMTVWFLIAIFNFIREKDATKMKDRRKQMINGLIGLFVAVAVWGIIRIAQNITGTNDTQPYDITCPPGYRPGNPNSNDAGTCVRG